MNAEKRFEFLKERLEKLRENQEQEVSELQAKHKEVRTPLYQQVQAAGWQVLQERTGLFHRCELIKTPAFEREFEKARNDNRTWRSYPENLYYLHEFSNDFKSGWISDSPDGGGLRVPMSIIQGMREAYLAQNDNQN